MPMSMKSARTRYISSSLTGFQSAILGRNGNIISLYFLLFGMNSCLVEDYFNQFPCEKHTEPIHTFSHVFCFISWARISYKFFPSPYIISHVLAYKCSNTNPTMRSVCWILRTVTSFSLPSATVASWMGESSVTLESSSESNDFHYQTLFHPEFSYHDHSTNALYLLTPWPQQTAAL